MIGDTLASWFDDIYQGFDVAKPQAAHLVYLGVNVQTFNGRPNSLRHFAGARRLTAGSLTDKYLGLLRGSDAGPLGLRLPAKFGQIHLSPRRMPFTLAGVTRP
jgi:hypothetical protein